MEHKTLTLKRPMIGKRSENTQPVIQRRRKQVMVNTQRKPNKLTKTASKQHLPLEAVISHSVKYLTTIVSSAVHYDKHNHRMNRLQSLMSLIH